MDMYHGTLLTPSGMRKIAQKKYDQRLPNNARFSSGQVKKDRLSMIDDVKREVFPKMFADDGTSNFYSPRGTALKRGTR